MKTSNAVVWLSSLIIALALVSASIGVFWQDGGGSFLFTTLHGQTTEMYGRGVYHYDTLFTGAAFRGTDAVTLVVGIPLLIASTLLYRGGSLRGGFLLTGALAYFLYNGASMAFGAAYNSLFLVYIALFSASLFAFVLAITSIDLDMLPVHISPQPPHRRMAIFLIMTSIVTLLVWLSDIVGGLVQGRVPELLGSYTTMITHVIDLGIIVPVAFLAGVLVFRRAPLGYLLAAPILMLCSMIGLVVVAQTVMQMRAGILFSTGVFVGMIGSWVVLSLIALWLTTILLRSIVDGTASRTAQALSTGGTVDQADRSVPAL